MRVLHLISSGGMYGAEAVILNLSRELNRSGHTSLLGIFSNLSNPNLQLHEAATDFGIESHLLPCDGQVDRRVPSRIRSLTAATRADLVHAHGYKADVYAWVAARNTRTPLVSTCHNWIDDGLFVRAYGRLDRRVLRQYNAVVAVSAGVQARLINSGVHPSRIHSIRNGIDLDRFTAVPPSLRRTPSAGAPLIGWVGRLSREKGPDIFIRAVAEIHREFPEARFILVGDGPDGEALQRNIVALGLAQVIELTGRRTDLPGIYASCDLMVSSSRYEGLPMAILEGMASSLPWVATSVGDVPTIVRNDETGLLVPPEDPAALAKALATLLRDPGKRSRMGGAARRLVEEEFSARHMAEEYLNVYQEVSMANTDRSKATLHTAKKEQH